MLKTVSFNFSIYRPQQLQALLRDLSADGCHVRIEVLADPRSPNAEMDEHKYQCLIRDPMGPSFFHVGDSLWDAVSQAVEQMEEERSE